MASTGLGSTGFDRGSSTGLGRARGSSAKEPGDAASGLRLALEGRDAGMAEVREATSPRRAAATSALGREKANPIVRPPPLLSR